MTVKWAKRSIQDLLLLAGITVGGFGLLTFSKPVSAATVHALELCINALLPSLFPFLVLSSFLISSGALTPVTSILGRTMHRLFRLPGCCSAAILLGIIGGYPVGARTVSQLYRSQICNKKDAEKVLLFCNNAGPPFFIGVIGANLLNDAALGCRLYFIHLFSAMIIGLAVSVKSRRKATEAINVVVQDPRSPLLPAVLQAVTGSIPVFLNICAFVLLFAVLLCLLQQSGLLLLFSAQLPGEPLLWNGIISGILELTSGADILAGSTLPLQIQLPLLSFLCGWGSLSVQMQTVSILHEADLPAKRYLLAKAIHGGLAAILTVFLCR